jgi:hypothetical protein
MMKKLNQISGFYEPSFFRLHIATNNTIEDVNKLNEKDFSIFLHEYIHFIQDTTTYYGLNNINYNVEYLRFANNSIVKQTNKIFKTPLYPKSDNSDNVLLNGHICKLTFGDTDAIENVASVKSYSISKIPINIPNKIIKEIEVVDVEIIDNSNNENAFSFGAGCIMESMAYIFEKITCDNYSKSPDIPYNSAEIIVKHILPKFGENILNILALCDISLSISNPAKYFILKLEEYRDNNYLPPTPESIYTDFFANTLVTNNTKAVSFSNNFTFLSDRIKSQLKGYFNDKHFDSLKEWIEEIIESTKLYRLKNPTFILDLAKGKMKHNSAFKQFFNIVGTPLMTNTKKEFRFYHPLAYKKQIEIGYFWAISQINSVFWGQSSSCEMKEMCNQPISNTVVDSRCDNEPWTRCSDTNLCPFALVWRHWGLASFVPTN